MEEKIVALAVQTKVTRKETALRSPACYVHGSGPNQSLRRSVQGDAECLEEEKT